MRSSHFVRSAVTMVVAAVVLLTGHTVSAQSLDEGFESYSVGSKVPGWMDRYSGTRQRVTDERSRSGDQSLKLTAMPYSSTERYLPFSTPNTPWELSFSALLDNSTTANDNGDLYVKYESPDYSVSFTIVRPHLDTGPFRIRHTGIGDAGQVASLDRWYDFQINVNPQARTASYFVDGTLLNANVPLGNGSRSSQLITHAGAINDGVLHGYIDDLRVRPWGAEPGRDAPISQPDPIDPPTHTSQYNFVLGAQPYFQWDGITVGLDFVLSVPAMDPIQWKPSITYPEDPFTPDLEPWELSYGTNSKIWGKALSALAPIEFNAVELTGTARLSADAEAQADISMTDGESDADIGASIGAGLNLTLSLEASSDVLNVLPGKVRDMLPLDFTFTYPVVGAGPFDSPTVDVSLPATMDLLVFREALAAADVDDAYETAADVIGSVNIMGVPFVFEDTGGTPDPDTVSVAIGASASAYAQTSATAGVDVYFHEVDEYGDLVQSESFFNRLGHVWTKSIALTDATMVTSDTGEVAIDPVSGIMKLLTGSPVWMVTLVNVESDTNLLAFSGEFASEDGAEGLLQVYWEDELVATIDERLAPDGAMPYMFALPDTFGVGVYELAFRVDSYNDVDSAVLISDVKMGYLASIPEPGTLGVLSLGGLALLRRRRAA